MKVSATPPSPGTPCFDATGAAAAAKSSAFYSPFTTATAAAAAASSATFSSASTAYSSCSSSSAVFSPIVVVSSPPPPVFDRRRLPHRCSNASSSVSSGGVTASSSSSSWSSAGSSGACNAAGDDETTEPAEEGGWLPGLRSDDDDAAAAAPAAAAAKCCLGVELVHLAESHELRPSEEAARQALRKGIARAVREVWAGCSVRCYGSFTYGLSTGDSPLDVVVEGCEGLEQRFHSVLAPLRGVVSVRRIMQEGPEAMLRATCVAAGTSVNITLFQSAERSQPRATAAFVRAQVRRFPALRSVVAGVRALLRADGVRCFTTYHLVLMALRVCEEADDARDPGALLVDFLDMYGQRLRLEQPAASASAEGDDSASAIVLRDPVTGANVASSLSLLDAHRLKVSLRARLHALHHFVEGKSTASCAFEAIMGYCTNQA